MTKIETFLNLNIKMIQQIICENVFLFAKIFCLAEETQQNHLFQSNYIYIFIFDLIKMSL